ncbi:MAG TPA: NIL domain-containing protein [Capsulimonadaceae bacterium]|jgi:ABC-type methionine transport system ATPase subunit
MTTQKLKLEYPLNKVGVPVFSQLVSVFDVHPNVLAADINPAKGGWLLISITGNDETLERAASWIREQGITLSAAD